MSSGETQGRVHPSKDPVASPNHTAPADSRLCAALFLGVDSAHQDQLIDQLGDLVEMGREITQGSAEELAKFNPRIVVIDPVSITRVARRASKVARSRSVDGTTVVILVCGSEVELGEREKLRTTYSADFCIDATCSKDALSTQVATAIHQRTPFSNLNLLPRDVAQRLDDMERALPNGSYYDLLGMTSRATESEIRAAFQTVSRWTHPDRHRRLKINHPLGFERLRRIHKRLTEAHSVLSRPRPRALYNTCLRRGGSLRYVGDNLPERMRDELEFAKTPAGKDAVSECIEARSLGRWHEAADALAQARALEPENAMLVHFHEMVCHVARIATSEDENTGVQLEDDVR
ncbi:MAG: DnaJ domain-containing protein [Myxococcota bacterium]|nr:DnaJ domain-containing protein [Myxococcota bacterium]